MKVSELPKSDAKLQMLFHKGNINFVNDDPNVETIDPETTVAMARKLDRKAWAWLKSNKEFMGLFRLVFPEDLFQFFEDDSVEELGLGMQHVIGLILLIRNAQRTGKKPFIRFPESYLHPAQQLGLGDLFIKI